MRGSRVSAPLRNQRLLPMPCHNYTTLISPDKEMTVGNHNATSSKHSRKDHAYQPHPLFLGGIHEKQIPNDTTITHLPQVKNTLNLITNHWNVYATLKTP